jgi:predicted ribosome quality control (RQC) complex YloA/Tae2 family protein
MPAWFRRLLVGPTTDFVTLLCTSEEQLDWGLSREIMRYRDLDKEAHALSSDIEVKHAELNALHQARDASEARLTLARAFEKVEVLSNLHRQGATQARSAWKKRKHLPRLRNPIEQGCSDVTMG